MKEPSSWFTDSIAPSPLLNLSIPFLPGKKTTPTSFEFSLAKEKRNIGWERNENTVRIEIWKWRRKICFDEHCHREDLIKSWKSFLEFWLSPWFPFFNLKKKPLVSHHSLSTLSILASGWPGTSRRKVHQRKAHLLSGEFDFGKNGGILFWFFGFSFSYKNYRKKILFILTTKLEFGWSFCRIFEVVVGYGSSVFLFWSGSFAAMRFGFFHYILKSYS